MFLSWGNLFEREDSSERVLALSACLHPRPAPNLPAKIC